MSDFNMPEQKKAKSASSPYGMVSTASDVATKAGIQMLEKGGNAVDAAVAAAFCLGVTEPQASGLGGQSMILLYLSKTTNGAPLLLSYDGSSRAPFGINPNRLPAKPMKTGIKATTVPSTPAALGYLLENYGSLSLAEILEPAITAARDGFIVSALQHRLLTREKDRLIDEAVREVFFKNGQPLKAGDKAVQPQLSKTLQKLAKQGWQDFYHGELGSIILADMQKRGGLITRADLSQIPLPIQREVLSGSYRSYSLATFPPPGAGRTLVQILSTLDQINPNELKMETPLRYLLFALSFRAALMNRERTPVGPELYPQLTNKLLVDQESVQRTAKRIKEMISYLDKEQFSPPLTSGETTHLSTADVDGNIVGITQSVELVFGAKTMADGLGFFYNNYMSAFDYKNMMHPYYLLPGGKPWSSVAPTLLFRKNGTPYMIMGSPGSERIATTLAQVISGVIDRGQSLAEAVEAPRLHSGSTGNVSVEKRIYTPEIIDTLTRAGFQVKSRRAYSFYLGCVQAVEIQPEEGGNFTGISDPRRDGSARGPRKLSYYETGGCNE